MYHNCYNESLNDNKGWKILLAKSAVIWRLYSYMLSNGWAPLFLITPLY